MLNSQKGMSMIEVLPMITIFVLIMNFAIGFFGVVHSGVKNSIASRNYAIETFRNRADLTYLRDSVGSEAVSYKSVQLRLHAKRSEFANSGPGGGVEWTATKRPIRFTDYFSINASDESLPGGASARRQVDSQANAGERIDFEGVNPVWVRVSYGMCLNAQCGDPR
jgi:hypothetical protein